MDEYNNFCKQLEKFVKELKLKKVLVQLVQILYLLSKPFLGCTLAKSKA